MNRVTGVPTKLWEKATTKRVHNITLASLGRSCKINLMSRDNLLSRITVDTGLCHGKPCIRGLRYPVESILEYLAGGDSVEQVLVEFPDLERDDILACVEFSRKMLAGKSVHLALT
jgi:uncharacterized protein (DUF433 family)